MPAKLAEAMTYKRQAWPAVVRAVAGEDQFPAAAEAARMYAGPGLREVTLDEPDAYWRLLKSMWAEGHTFVLLEHDIVIEEGVIADLLACPGWFCGRAYLMMGAAFGAAFGCTKFDARLIALYPNAWDDIVACHDQMPGAYFRPGEGPTHWRSLDSRFAWLLQRIYGFGIQCTHWPAIPHLNPTFMAGRDPYEAARQSPHPRPHHCIQGHPCRCLLGAEQHPCPARSNLDGSGVIVHTQPRLESSGQEAPGVAA